MGHFSSFDFAFLCSYSLLSFTLNLNNIKFTLGLTWAYEVRVLSSIDVHWSAKNIRSAI